VVRTGRAGPACRWQVMQREHAGRRSCGMWREPSEGPTLTGADTTHAGIRKKVYSLIQK